MNQNICTLTIQSKKTLFFMHINPRKVSKGWNILGKVLDGQTCTLTYSSNFVLKLHLNIHGPIHRKRLQKYVSPDLKKPQFLVNIFQCAVIIFYAGTPMVCILSLFVLSTNISNK